MDEGVKRIIDEALALDARKRAEATAPEVRGKVAGFWIRVLADFLDAVVLFGVGALLDYDW